MTLYYDDHYGNEVLELRLDTYAFDIGDRGKASSRRLDLRTWSDADWSKFDVRGSVEVPDDVFDVFPEGARDSPPAKLILAVDCPDVHERFGLELAAPPLEPGSYSFEVALEREFGYGSVQLSPVAMLEEDLPTKTANYATFEGQRIADGRPGRILFDDLGQDRGGSMNVEFKSFSDTQIPDSNLYHLHRGGSDLPEVWVNEDHQLIADVLDVGGHTGFRPLLRDVLADWIAMDVTVQLVEWAIVGAGEGEFTEPWQERILDEYGPSLYEATRADSPSELHEMFHGEFGDDPHFLINQIETTVQRESEVGESLTTFIERQAPDYLDYGED